jgi:hypothetical protein
VSGLATSARRYSAAITATLAIESITYSLAPSVRDRGNEPTAADLVAKYAWRPSAELARMIEQLQAGSQKA